MSVSDFKIQPLVFRSPFIVNGWYFGYLCGRYVCWKNWSKLSKRRKLTPHYVLVFVHRSLASDSSDTSAEFVTVQVSKFYYMGWFSSSKPEQPNAASRQDRQKCWETRDAYFSCLDGVGVVKAGEEGSACSKQEAQYEENCAKSWVSCFKLRLVYLLLTAVLWSNIDRVLQSKTSHSWSTKRPPSTSQHSNSKCQIKVMMCVLCVSFRFLILYI